MNGPRQDDRDALLDIVTHLEAAQDFVGRYSTFNDFAADAMATYAVVRAIEVAGEAARRVPKDVREQHPDIPWKEMIGMRDRLIHGYDSVNTEVVWQPPRSRRPMSLSGSVAC